VRVFLHKNLKPPEYAPDYRQFIDAAGIEPERDLDEAAIALHRMADPNGPNGPVAYSMVLVGKITGKKLNAWLDAHAGTRESYAGHTVYNIPSEGRTVRVAQIGYDMLAVSNYPTPEMIHSMLDRHATAALPFANSTMLRQYYHEVPLLSPVWGVGQIALPFSDDRGGAIKIFGFSLPLEPDSTIIASVTPALSLGGALNVKVVEIAPSIDKAASQAESLNVLLILTRGITAPLADNAANDSLKELLKTAEITQKRDRVVVTATLTPSLFGGPVGMENSSQDSPSVSGGLK
jgi:hypothetical protein